MIDWTNIIKRPSDLRGFQPCSNENCAAGRWRLWSRRGSGIHLNDKWFCSETCLEAALSLLLDNPSRVEGDRRPSAHRLPLGLLMLSRGIIDEDQLKAALAVQNERPRLKIGQCLEKLGAVSGKEVTRALGAQHCLPVLVAFQPELESGIPLTLLQASRCVAFSGNYHVGMTYMGFDGPVDRSLLAAVEFILGVQCEPCIVDSLVIEEHLEASHLRRRPDEIVFDSTHSKADIVRSIGSYAHQIRADLVRLATTRQYLWAQVRGNRKLDLLFVAR